MTLRKSPASFLALFGTATLVGGTLAGIEAGCLTNPGFATIILSRNTPAGTPGKLTAPSASRGLAATTFTITSNNAAETSTVNWMAIPRLNIPSFGVNAGGPFRRPPSGRFMANGETTLIAGTKTVSTGMQFGANAKIFVTYNTTSGTPGNLSAPSASVNPAAGTFVINSSSGTDVSTVDWVVVDELRSSVSGPPLYQANKDMVAGSAFFSGAPGIDNPAFSVLASVINIGGTPGFLTASDATRDSSGGFSIISSIGVADTSLVETIVF